MARDMELIKPKKTIKGLKFYKKQSGKFAVTSKGGKFLKADEKISALVKAGLKSTPKAKKKEDPALKENTSETETK